MLPLSRLPRRAEAPEAPAATFRIGSAIPTLRSVRLLLLSVAVVLLSACSSTPLKHVVLGPDYQVSNVFRLSSGLPQGFRRVALLPLAIDPALEEAPTARQTLEPILLTELLKTKRFDVVRVSPEKLQQWSGRSHWSAEDKLPPDFLTKLNEETGCDGILFAELSRYRPYPPLALGWKLKLVAEPKGLTLWSVDELFDAGEARVVNSARRYENEHLKAGPSTDSPMILASPQRFGQYTLSSLLETLPTP